MSNYITLDDDVINFYAEAYSHWDIAAVYSHTDTTSVAKNMARELRDWRQVGQTATDIIRHHEKLLVLMDQHQITIDQLIKVVNLVQQSADGKFAYVYTTDAKKILNP